VAEGGSGEGVGVAGAVFPAAAARRAEEARAGVGNAP